jgi:O-antigen/teichoic acid export membrane protein
VESNLEKSKLFAEYIDLLVPLTFFALLFVQLDTFNKLLYNAVFGTFLQEFLQRALIFAVTILFILNVFDLHQLVLAYVIAVCAKTVVLIGFLLANGELNLKPNFRFIEPKLRKEMISVAAYSILTGLGGSIVFNIDKILVNQLLGLSATGVYTIAFFFGTLVIIPSRPLLRITGTLIADAWKRNDIAYIADIYKKSCLNQFIIGAFLFGGIWINIDNILIILGPEYTEAKWVIFFIGLAYLVDMATGANAHIIAYSRHYRVALYFILVLIVLVVTSMFFLIKIWGITGGAVAIALSFTINNLIRFVFLKMKFQLQPFSTSFFLVFAAFFLAYFANSLIPDLPLVWSILAKSSLFTLVFGMAVIGFKISEDASETFKKALKLLRLKMKK